MKEGAGYFDVRNKNEEWVRIMVGPGDLLVLVRVHLKFSLQDADLQNIIICVNISVCVCLCLC